MTISSGLGQIIILNGAPRSGKSSIAEAIQGSFGGVWMNLGVDNAIRTTPGRLRPGIGLRPGAGDGKLGGDRPELEPLVPVLYAALYESIAVHSRLGLNVVSDTTHHTAIHPTLLSECARRLDGLAVLFVGVRCPIEVVMERRAAATSGAYALGTADDPFPAPARLWQEEVHKPGIYDLEVDTSALRPEECAEVIRTRLHEGPPPSAFAQLAGL